MTKRKNNQGVCDTRPPAPVRLHLSACTRVHAHAHGAHMCETVFRWAPEPVPAIPIKKVCDELDESVDLVMTEILQWAHPLLRHPVPHKIHDLILKRHPGQDLTHSPNLVQQLF